jgi:hypothetical protein
MRRNVANREDAMNSKLGWMVGAAAAVLVCGWRAAPAQAQVWVDMTQIDKVPDWADPQYVKQSELGKRWIEPVYRVRYVRKWCPPVYRPVCKRIWHEPVIRVWYDRCWVPPRYGWVETVCWEHGVKVIRREWTCIEPGHWQTVRREEVVKPGWWEEVVVERHVVEDGHWTTVEERELVAAGHWAER